MDGKYCEKCNTALVRCSDCAKGKQPSGYKCPKCNGTGYVCQVHGGKWQK